MLCFRWNFSWVQLPSTFFFSMNWNLCRKCIKRKPNCDTFLQKLATQFRFNIFNIHRYRYRARVYSFSSESDFDCVENKQQFTRPLMTHSGIWLVLDRDENSFVFNEFIRIWMDPCFSGVMSDRKLWASSDCVYATHRCPVLHPNEANDANDTHFII